MRDSIYVSLPYLSHLPQVVSISRTLVGLTSIAEGTPVVDWRIWDAAEEQYFFSSNVPVLNTDSLWSEIQLSSIQYYNDWVFY